MTILDPFRQFSDSRGQMLGVINDGQWEEINFISTAASCLRGGHYHRDTRELFLLISGAAATAGYLLLGTATPMVPATILAFAAGGVLAMLAESMIPEAFANAQAFIGLITVVGFIVAFLIIKVTG